MNRPSIRNWLADYSLEADEIGRYATFRADYESGEGYVRYGETGQIKRLPGSPGACITRNERKEPYWA